MVNNRSKGNTGEILKIQFDLVKKKKKKTKGKKKDNV